MDFNILNWNWTEKAAAGRHVLTYVSGIATTLVAVHFLTPQDASAITDNLNTIWDGAVKIGTGLTGLAGVLAPIYAALTAKKSAEPASQIKAVVSNLSAPQVAQVANAVADPEGRNKLISAVAEMPEVRAIVAPQAVVRATESAKVVNTPEAVAPLPLAVVPRTAA